MRVFVFVVLFSFISSALSQTNQSWSEEISYSSNVIKTLPKDKNSYYVITTASNSFKDLRIHYFNFGKQISDNSLNPKTSNAISRIEDVFIVGDQLYVFFSEESVSGNKLFAQRLDEQGQLMDMPFMLREQEIKGGFNEKNINYIISVSPNRKFLSITYLFNNMNVFEFPDLVTSVYNSNLHRIKEDITKTEYYLSRLSLESVKTDNEGTVLTLMQGFKAPSSSKLKYNSLDLYLLTTTKNREHLILESGEYSFFNPMLTTNTDTTYTIAYQYNTLGKWKPNDGSIGVFFYDYSCLSQKISERKSLRYDKDDLEKRLMPKERKRYEKATAKGQAYNLALFRYRLKDVELLKDSSRLLIMEESWTETGYYQSGRSYITYTIYNYNNILLMKYNNQQVKEYVVNIPKFQISRDDNGYYSSFIYHVKENNKLYLLFNDNLNNYSTSGDYLNNQQPYNFTFNVNKFCTALVEVNLQTGNYQRRTLFTKSDVENLFVPKIFERDDAYQTNVLTFNRRNRFRFASMTF